jgi:hypothetical protein
MRTLIIGDGHDKWTTITPLIDKIVGRYDVNRIVLMGDLLNDWSISAVDELREIKHLHDWISSQTIRVDVLAGNHDAYYLLDASDHSYGADEVWNQSPGHHYEFRGDVHELLTRLPRPIQASTVIHSNHEDWLLSHAGVTSTWFQLHLDGTKRDPEKISHDVNRMLEVSDWDQLYTIGVGRGGRSTPSPLWADKKELLDDPLPGISQIVGHTPVPTVEEWMRHKDEGTSRWPIVFVDTMSTLPDGSMIGDWTALICDDDDITTISLENPGELVPLHREYDTRYEQIIAEWRARRAHDSQTIDDDAPAWRNRKRHHDSHK